MKRAAGNFINFQTIIFTGSARSPIPDLSWIGCRICRKEGPIEDGRIPYDLRAHRRTSRIPLDIFRANLHNKGINNELDAWLTFLSADEPETIEQLIKEYPQFKPMYQQIYEICRNTERVMGLYSEELKILDKNTVQLMIDEMQDEIDGQKKALLQKDEQLSRQAQQLSRKDEQIEQQLQEITRLKRRLAEN